MGKGRPRLFVEAPLVAGARVALDAARAHYLGRVMRLGPGAGVALFNGRDGEWLARVVGLDRDGDGADVLERLRPQAAGPDLWLAFAPVKRAPIDAVARAATELGVAVLRPVMTRHTAVGRVNVARLRANAIEAAEQCGRLTVPEVVAPVTLTAMIRDWPPDRRLLVPDLSGAGFPIARALAAAGEEAARAPWAVLVGPEGGFADSELDLLGDLPFVTRVGLGPRILRADTAALAALACWQALVGDGAAPPPGRR